MPEAAAQQPEKIESPESQPSQTPQVKQPEPAASAAAAPPAQATGDKAARPSIYADVGEAEPGAKGSAAWPDDWREQMAEGDPKALEALKRFDSPLKVGKSWMAAAQRIRTGEYKRSAPKDDTPEAMAAWREENGIPKDASGYDIPLPKGVTFDKLDKGTQESIGMFRETFLKMDLSNDHAKQMMATAQEIAARQMETQAANDAKAQEAVEDKLRAEWGNDYRGNIRANVAFLEKHFGEEADAVLMARTPDGRRLVDIPAFSKNLNAWARAEGGDIMIDGQGAPSSVEGRIGEIKKIMDTDFARYQREGMADEYMKLIERREARAQR